MTGGSEIRRLQPIILQERLAADTLPFVPANGYRGGHLVGIPMTSERLLLAGYGKNLHVMVFRIFLRNDQLRSQPLGFTEPTATVTRLQSRD